MNWLTSVSDLMLARSVRYQGSQHQMREVRTPTKVHQTTNTTTPGVISRRNTSPPPLTRKKVYELGTFLNTTSVKENHKVVKKK